MANPRGAGAKERAYAYIKSNIINETFKPGNFLTEEEIAQNLGVSRTPVREAFLLLAAERFVTIFPQRGAFIPTISTRDMIEVIETRILIEQFATERFFSTAHPLAELQSLLEEQYRMLNDNDVEHFIECDRQFHSVIVQASENTLLVEIYDSLRDKLLRMGVRAVADSPERMQQVIHEHRRIVGAAQDHDIQLMKDAIRSHLNKTLSALRAHRE